MEQKIVVLLLYLNIKRVRVESKRENFKNSSARTIFTKVVLELKV